MSVHLTVIVCSVVNSYMYTVKYCDSASSFTTVTADSCLLPFVAHPNKFWIIAYFVISVHAFNYIKVNTYTLLLKWCSATLTPFRENLTFMLNNVQKGIQQFCLMYIQTSGQPTTTTVLHLLRVYKK